MSEEFLSQAVITFNLLILLTCCLFTLSDRVIFQPKLTALMAFFLISGSFSHLVFHLDVLFIIFTMAGLGVLSIQIFQTKNRN